MSAIKTPQVYKAICAVVAELAKTGIAKTQENIGAGYVYRGIDDVYNALSPVISRNGLVIIPRFVERHDTEHVNREGEAVFGVTVEAEFDFVSVEDGSTHTARTFGEAMDVGDKATNKAMSAAYKYAIFQTFCIPTKGDNDADASNHDLADQKDIEVDEIITRFGECKNKTELEKAWKALSADERLAAKNHFLAAKKEMESSK
jgi:hypothetical protein